MPFLRGFVNSRVRPRQGQFTSLRSDARSYDVNTSRINPDGGAPTVSPMTPTVSTSVAAQATVTTAARPPRRRELGEELAAVADNLAGKLLECQAASMAWLISAGQILGDHQSQLSHGDMTAIYSSDRLPLGQRFGQMLSAIARNKALCNLATLKYLPNSITAIAALASVEPHLIELGVRDGTIHRRLTRRGAMAAARKLRTQALLKTNTQPATSV